MASGRSPRPPELPAQVARLGSRAQGALPRDVPAAAAPPAAPAAGVGRLERGLEEGFPRGAVAAAAAARLFSAFFTRCRCAATSQSAAAAAAAEVAGGAQEAPDGVAACARGAVGDDDDAGRLGDGRRRRRRRRRRRFCFFRLCFRPVSRRLFLRAARPPPVPLPLLPLLPRLWWLAGASGSLTLSSSSFFRRPPLMPALLFFSYQRCYLEHCVAMPLRHREGAVRGSGQSPTRKMTSMERRRRRRRQWHRLPFLLPRLFLLLRPLLPSARAGLPAAWRAWRGASAVPLLLCVLLARERTL